ncbi:MAG: threonine synthase [Cytophagales bacterium]|nr:threonine synthase [Cytophagales bacterium]MDW8383858.1 threonine synthase [Flammeovirgaceae bacterium]
MKYYSTNHQVAPATLKEAVLKGLAADNGLYMPERINPLPSSFFKKLPSMSMAEIGFEVASFLFEQEIPSDILKKICEESFNFEIPLVRISEQIYSLELFHGPTLAFKDVGARFMSRLMSYFNEGNSRELFVLAATSGDTGSAVAAGFYNVKGIRVILLYPKGKVSKIQEQQLTTFGGNITALEVEGVFDDCQRLVKQAFLDEELNKKMTLTSANSINLARFIPQSFYYFYAFGQLNQPNKEIIFSVPSGNFGNLTAGVMAWKLGLPVKKFIAATNINDIVPEYIRTGEYHPRPSIKTIANAMDVGNPNNFPRLQELFDKSYSAFCEKILGFRQTDDEIRKTMRQLYQEHRYIVDPHGAIGYAALKKYLQSPYEIGIFLETAHPAKFYDEVEKTLGFHFDLPENLKVYLQKEKKAIPMSASFDDFKSYLQSL